jgi:hypothetical protein
VEPPPLDYRTPPTAQSIPISPASKPAWNSLRAGAASWLAWFALYFWTIGMRGTFLWGMTYRLFIPVAWIVAFSIPASALFGLISGIVAIVREKSFHRYAAIGFFLSALNLLAITAVVTLLYIWGKALSEVH